MTQLQELLGRILKSRIEREKLDGTLEDDRVNLSQTLDVFMASNKITSEKYKEFTELIAPEKNVKDTSINDETEKAVSQAVTA